MTQQQLIKQIESKIKKTTGLIQSQKQRLTQHENNLSALIEELTKIKQQIKENNMKNNQESLKGSNINNK